MLKKETKGIGTVDDLPKKEEKIEITKDRARMNIAQWLYVNDGVYPSKNEWRVHLLEMIDYNIKHLKS